MVKKTASNRNKAGLRFYKNWEIDKAIAAFQDAATQEPTNPEYHLNLARAFARGSDYHQAIGALGIYLSHEPNEEVAAPYERLFSSALDEVESILIETMRRLKRPIQETGKAMQMWLEYRITVERYTLAEPNPGAWAAALAYAIAKINFIEVQRQQIADAFEVEAGLLKANYKKLVKSLDLMPADYRYFVGDNNPLDKLVEAAQILEELDRRFQSDD